MKSILPLPWGNQLGLCVKQGPTFCLHGEQTIVIPLLVAMQITTGIDAGIGALPCQSIHIKNYQKNFLMT
jgi:hypothetical protein